MSRHGQRGSVTVFVTILSVTLIFVAGLVVDGGRILSTRRAAANVAESAARAGAQAIDEDELRRSGQTILHSAQAEQRALALLAANGYSGTVEVSAGAVTVHATIRRELQILGIGGLASVTITATGKSEPVHAINGVDP